MLAAELAPDAPATPWLIGGGYALATTAGVLRVVSGNHFATDAVAGAALGSCVGYLVTRLHVRHTGPSGTVEGAGTLSALGPGVAVRIRF